MGKYYNTQRGPLAVSLSSGKSITVPPKSWIDIDPSDEGSPSLAPMIRKGYLKRSALPDPAPVPDAAPVTVAAPAAAARAPVPTPSLPPSDKKDSAAPAPKSVTAAGEIKK
jgi:hypothetical protein